MSFFATFHKTVDIRVAKFTIENSGLVNSNLC